jgi:Ca2+-binding EF-hand superfamily protein
MKQLIAASTLIFLVISASVLASAASIRFAHLDKDMDGKISFNEAKQDKEVLKQFTDLDENNDKMISKKEFKRFKP